MDVHTSKGDFTQANFYCQVLTVVQIIINISWVTHYPVDSISFVDSSITSAGKQITL